MGFQYCSCHTKKDGSIRFCVDYHKLNLLTRKDVYPLPRIDTCLDTLSGAVWYSTFDLRSGFHQVKVNPRDVNKTTFTCHRGTFRFPRMPFGLCNAPATFQHLMDTVLMGLNCEICLAYLDDIIMFSKDLHSHLDRLLQLFQRLREAELKLKPSKCKIMYSSVAFSAIQLVEMAQLPTMPKFKPCETGPYPPAFASVEHLLAFANTTCPHEKGRTVCLVCRMSDGIRPVKIVPYQRRRFCTPKRRGPIYPRL